MPWHAEQAPEWAAWPHEEALRRLYAALGCAPLILPSGGLYELDWRDAHRDNEHLDWCREVDRRLGRPARSPEQAGLYS